MWTTTHRLINSCINERIKIDEMNTNQTNSPKYPIRLRFRQLLGWRIGHFNINNNRATAFSVRTKTDRFSMGDINLLAITYFNNKAFGICQFGDNAYSSFDGQHFSGAKRINKEIRNAEMKQINLYQFRSQQIGHIWSEQRVQCSHSCPI